MRLLNFRPKPEPPQPPAQWTPDWKIKQGSLPIEVKRNSKPSKDTAKGKENYANVLKAQKEVYY